MKHIFFSLKGEYCNQNGYDPQDPPCPRLILTGSIEKIPEESPEFALARLYLFTRHPSMINWPSGHLFYFAKMNLQNILLLANFGGAATVSVEDFYNASLVDKNEMISLFSRWKA